MKMSPIFILDASLAIVLLLGNAISAEVSTVGGMITSPDDAATSSSEDDDDISKEKTDLKSLMLKYESDDGNSCLLDMIKDEVIWWIFPNGTLKENTKTFGKHGSSIKLLKSPLNGV